MKNISQNFKVLTSVTKGQTQAWQTIVWVGIANFLYYINLFFDNFIYTHILPFHFPIVVDFHLLPPSYQVTSHMVNVFSPGGMHTPNNESNLRRKGFIWLHLQVKVRILGRNLRHKLRQRLWKNPASWLVSHVFFSILILIQTRTYLPTVG